MKIFISFTFCYLVITMTKTSNTHVEQKEITWGNQKHWKRLHRWCAALEREGKAARSFHQGGFTYLFEEA